VSLGDACQSIRAGGWKDIERMVEKGSCRIE
jgi:hypothetical protein